MSTSRHPQRKSLGAGLRPEPMDDHNQTAKTLRRQTIAGKENPRHSASSPSLTHHKNKPLNLGHASSYYFQGAPPTPVQTMVHEKLLEQQQQTHDHTQASFRSNTSYMSSSSEESSSSGGGGGDDTMNLTTVSDTTELTAGNFVTLAATMRPPRRRQTVGGDVPVSTQEPVSAMVVEKPLRRQTLGPSTQQMNSVLQTLQGQRQEQETQQQQHNNNNTSEYTLSKNQMSELLHLSVLGNSTSNPRLSINFDEAPPPSADATVPPSDHNNNNPDNCPVPESAQANVSNGQDTTMMELETILPSSSSQEAEADHNDNNTTLNESTQYDLQAILQHRPRYSESTTTAVLPKLPANSQLTKYQTFASPNKRPSEASAPILTDMALSPARSTRSSTKKEAPSSPAVDNNNSHKTSVSPARSTRSKSSPARKHPDSPILTDMALSPARSTRSSIKKMAQSSPGTTSVAPPPSPRSVRSSTKKQTNQSMDSPMALSPARSTRGSTKKTLLAPTVLDSPARHTRSAEKKRQSHDSTGSYGDLFEGLPPSQEALSAGKQRKEKPDDTTESVGEMLAGLFPSGNAVSNNEEAKENATNGAENISFKGTIDNEQDQSTISLGSVLPSKKDVAVTKQVSRGSIDITHPTNAGNLDTTSLSLGSLLGPRVSSASKPETGTVSIGSLLKGLPTTATGENAAVDDGTESLGGLLDKEGGKKEKDAAKLDSPSTKEYDSMDARSKVSVPSTISTPTGMSAAAELVENGSSPMDPPSTILFRMDRSSSMIRDSIGKSPLKQALTPSKLAPSPRRLLLNMHQKPPPRTSLTPSKLPPSPVRLPNAASLVRLGPSPLKKPLSATRLPPSPLRRPISVHAKRSSVEGSEESILSSSAKRQKMFEHLQKNSSSQDSQEEVTANISIDKRNESLHSVLRQPGSARPKSTRKVAFGSPTIMSFNLASPSNKMTPMPKNGRIYQDLPEDTAELEQDMASLHEGGMAKHAGSTPFAKRLKSSVDASMETSDEDSGVLGESIDLGEDDKTMELEDNVAQNLKMASSTDSSDDMSVDTTEGDAAADQEHTVALEENMTAVLNGATTETNQEHTVALEENMTAVLGQVLAEETGELNQKEGESTAPLSGDEHTVEIETDINALLNIDDDNVSDDESLTLNVSRSRRQSISSRRFSVAPAGRLSVSYDDASNQAPLSMAATPVKTTNESTPTKLEQQYDLKVGEIISAIHECGTSLYEPADYLFNVNESVREFEVSETMNALVGQVLQTLNSSTVDDLDPSASVEVSDEKIQAFVELQNSIRSNNNLSFKQEFANVVESFRACDIFEWSSWLVSVFERLEQPLEEKSIGLDDEINRLDEMCYDIERSLAAVSDKAARQARRKSMDNREASIAALESEIRDLEKAVEEAESHRDTLASEFQKVTDKVLLIDQNDTLTTTTREKEQQAMMAEKAFSSLRGLTKWKPVVVTDTEYSFHYLGPIPQASIELVFGIKSFGAPVTCRVTVQEELFKKYAKRRAKQFAAVSTFLESRATEICSSVSNKTLSDPSQIGHFTRQLEWQLGRMETTATELVSLQRRYKVFLTPSPTADSSSNFLVEVEFSKQSYEEASLRVTFEVSKQYPFGSLDMRMDAFEEDVDMENLRQLLQKNAKPGFGYLSRTCDVIDAFLR